MRVKAVKYGHKLEDIAPAYSDEFYLPDKDQYFVSAIPLKTNEKSRKQETS